MKQDKFIQYILVFCLFFLPLLGEEMDVDIKADNFSADKSKNIIIFTGKVSMIKGADTLYSDKLTVLTKLTKDGKTLVKEYIAVGKVNITLKRPTTVIKGKGNQITYDVDNQIYVITGNGYLEDVAGQKIIKGEKIHYDEKNGNTNIDGAKNKPVEFKLKIESNK